MVLPWNDPTGSVDFSGNIFCLHLFTSLDFCAAWSHTCLLLLHQPPSLSRGWMSSWPNSLNQSHGASGVGWEGGGVTKKVERNVAGASDGLYLLVFSGGNPPFDCGQPMVSETTCLTCIGSQFFLVLMRFVGRHFGVVLLPYVSLCWECVLVGESGRSLVIYGGSLVSYGGSLVFDGGSLLFEGIYLQFYRLLATTWSVGVSVRRDILRGPLHVHQCAKLRPHFFWVVFT